MNRSIIPAIAITVALSALGSPASAQVGNDVKCLLASNLFANSAKDPKVRVSAEANRFFYLGRIYGRLNATQLKTQMLAQQKSITKSNAGQIMNACASQMAAGVKLVQTVTQGLNPAK
jgi:hypothetical protein